MAKSMQGDEQLLVKFFSREITKGTPRTETWVQINNPVDPRSELIQRASSMSHTDPETGDVVSYADRFTKEYEAFAQDAGKNRDERVADLKKQLQAAEGTKFDSMTDDELRAYIKDRTGNDVPGSVSKHSTLVRMAVEVEEG